MFIMKEKEYSVRYTPLPPSLSLYITHFFAKCCSRWQKPHHLNYFLTFIVAVIPLLSVALAI